MARIPSVREVEGTDNRFYLVSADGQATFVGRHYGPSPEDEEAEAAAVAYAEFGSSWVFGGGDPADVPAAYRQWVEG